MEICFFIGAMSKGGAEKQLVYIANGLSKKGHKVKILAMRGGAAYLDLLDDSVAVSVLHVAGPLDSFCKTYKFISRDTSDVVVCFLFHATIIGRLLSPLLGAKVVSSYRNVSYGSRVKDFCIRWTAFLDSLTLSNTSSAKYKLLRKSARKKLKIIPNIFDENGAASGKLDLPKEKGFRWCYVGRLEGQKNVYELVLAFKSFKDKTSIDSQLIILGDGSYRKQLECLVNEMNVSDIHFLGHSYHVKDLFNTCDAFILPSRWEGMPNSLMEAMACQLPSVATPVGAIPEMIINGVTGFLADGYDAESLKNAMDNLYMTDGKKLKEIGIEASRYIHEKCSEVVVIGMWEMSLKYVVFSD